MTIALKVDDIAGYLTDNGWARNPAGWHGATVWQHPDDYEVLVPAQDGMGDADRRVREILRCLAAVEHRPSDEIAQEIQRPQLDKQYFRTFPANHDAGYTSLQSGVQTMQGVRSILGTATRTVLQGPHFAFFGRAPGAIGDLLRAAELGPSRAGSYVIEVRLAMDLPVRTQSGLQVDGRAVLIQLLEAVSAAQAAVLTDVPAAFDESVTAGVSADLCRALSDLTGADRNEPFEINFRWSRLQPLDVPSHVLAFPETAGALLQAAVGRLRGLNASGPATVTGTVEGLHDDAPGDDRWRIKVRGELRTDRVERARRAVWIRLADQAEYERAIIAQREQHVITVAGELSSTTGRVELVPWHRLEI